MSDSVVPLHGPGPHGRPRSSPGSCSSPGSSQSPLPGSATPARRSSRRSRTSRHRSIRPRKQVPLDAAARKVAGRFILTAVARQNLAESYALAHPELRQGMSKREWLTGNIPVVYYPAKQIETATFKVDESYPGESDPGGGAAAEGRGEGEAAGLLHRVEEGRAGDGGTLARELLGPARAPRRSPNTPATRASRGRPAAVAAVPPAGSQGLAARRRRRGRRACQHPLLEHGHPRRAPLRGTRISTSHRSR